MALILSAASGNFNAGATWVGGIVPGAADEARASTGHTVTITANVTCTELSNAGTGTYVLNSGVTLTANVTAKSTTNPSFVVTFASATPSSATINGNITAGTSNTSVAVRNNSSGTLTINGNTTGGSTTNCVAIQNASTGILVFNGNVTGGSNATASGIENSSTGTVTVTNGTISGGSLGYGIWNFSIGTCTVTGTCTASGGAGIQNNSTGAVTITGTLTPTTTVHALQCANTTGANITLSGSLIYASNGFAPTNCLKFLMNPTPTTAKVRFAKNGSTTFSEFFTADNSLGQAAITDVRFGTVYASGALTGVAYIPSASSVAFGVPVDNTTGTATLTAADVRAAIGMASANLDTQLSTISTKASEVHAIHGLDIANALTVTPTLRSAGAITQAITGDGTTSTIVTRV